MQIDEEIEAEEEAARREGLTRDGKCTKSRADQKPDMLEGWLLCFAVIAVKPNCLNDFRQGCGSLLLAVRCCYICIRKCGVQAGTWF